MSQLWIAAVDMGYVLGACAIGALCGWWAVAPLRRFVGYPSAAAVLAGATLLPLLSLTVSVLLSWPYARSAAVAIFVLASMSVLVWRAGMRPSLRDDFVPSIGVGVATAVLVVGSVLITELRAGEPALAYMHGSDHLGYAHAADWLRSHLKAPALTQDPAHAYASYVDILYKNDPRFGSFAALALTGIASGRSGTFAYDLACAIFGAAAALSLAGAFSRRLAPFAIASFALAMSPLYDQAQNGYFGKLCGFPASILATRLMIAWCELAQSQSSHALRALVPVGAVAAAAAIMFNGLVTAVLVTSIGLTFLALQAVNAKNRPARLSPEITNDLIWMVLFVAAISWLASGVVARPLFLAMPSIDLPWIAIAVRAIGVDSQLFDVTLLPQRWVVSAMALVTAAGIGAAAVSVKSRAHLAAAFLLAPVLVVLALVITEMRSQAYQFTTALAPLWICGAIALVCHLSEASGRASWRPFAALFAAMLIGVQVPRFAGAVRHYGITALPELRFYKGEADALESAIGRCGAYIEYHGHVHSVIFLLVEMGSRGVPLQWSPASWNLVLRYRPWPPPTYSRISPLRIIERGGRVPDNGEIVLRTTQFDLIRLVDAGVAAPGTEPTAIQCQAG